MSFKTILLAAAMLCGAAAPVFAADLVNGSFEVGDDPGPGLAYLGGGAAAIAGWTVGGTGVDYVGGHWRAAEGTRSLGLSGAGASSIAQSFATDAGATYAILFEMSGDPGGGLGSKQLVVAVDGIQQSVQTYDVTAVNSLTEMYWQTYIVQFTVSSGMTTLSFGSLGTDGHGPALDNVQLFGVDSVDSPTPEPMTWALMGIGFVVTGGVARRRTRAGRHAVGNT